MFAAQDDSLVVLQGPRPLFPPSWWAAHWGLVVAGVVAGYLILLLITRWRTRGQRHTPPLRQLEAALQQATDVAKVSRAVRAYLAAVDAELSAALSTEELASKLSQKPIFLPAQAPLLAALRAADEVKFAAAQTDLLLIIAGVREAAQRIESSQKLFAGGKKSS